MGNPRDGPDAAVVATPAAEPHAVAATPWAIADGMAMILGGASIAFATSSAVLYLFGSSKLKRKEVNRISPKGFKNSTFAEHLCEPIGAAYADGQYWDDIELTPPGNCTKVSVWLMYQSVSWEYIKFLAEQNNTDDWGRRLYQAWNTTGQCPPVVIAEITRDVNAGG